MKQATILEMIKNTEVEWKPLGKITDISTGQAVSKQKISVNEGVYPVINSGREPLGYINEWNTENNPIGITTRGAGVGSITWQEGKYFRGNLNYSVTIKDLNSLDVRFLYHLLSYFQSSIHSLCTFTGIPALNASELKKLKLPIPKELSIQQEIVKRLDKLTELEATLEAELVLRKKQYHYFRDLLLTFGDSSDRGGYANPFATEDVVWKSLGEVGELIRGVTYNKALEVTEDGYKVLRANNITVQFSTLNFDDVKQISKDAKVKDIQKLSKNDILISVASGSREHVGKVAFINENMDYYFGGFMAVIRSNEWVTPKYLFHILKSYYFSQFIETTFASATINNLSNSVLKDFKIPIPPLSTQEKIVQILDKFDCLANDISEGLPKEIVLRRKQYEYYREQLLNFPKPKN